MKSNPYEKLLTAFTLFLLTLAPLVVKAQKTRELTREEKNDVKKTTQKRIALVIGNGAYTKAKPLPNPPNDAADMAQTLRDLGFEVISGVNQNKRQTETLIREFGTRLANSGGIGLFYYAGHGIQVSGENYLVPVDADIPEEDEVSYSAVPLSLVLSKMTTAKNDLNIVIPDACRNNPFARSWRGYRDSSSNEGLAKISPPTGTLVLYATEPGKVASDGAGRNGLFTEALLKQIKRPNLEYDQMVKALSTDVWQKSNRQQLPWKEGNSLADFYFAGNGQKTNTDPIPNDNRNEPVIAARNKEAREREAWDLVKNSSNADELRLFLKNFPDGANSATAQIKLRQFESVNNKSGQKLIGTTWECETTNTTFPTKGFQFLSAGTLYYGPDTKDLKYKNNGSWQRKGNEITLSLNKDFVVYKGIITGNEMQGNASNREGAKWNWTCRKIPR